MKNTQYTFVLFMLFWVGPQCIFPLTAQRGTDSLFREHIEYLASEELEGRLTSGPGEKLAAEYIAAEFEQAGLLPAGDNGSYFQRFPFVKYRIASIQNPLLLSETIPLEAYNHFHPLAMSTDTAQLENLAIMGLEFGVETEDYSLPLPQVPTIAVIKTGLPEGVSMHSPEALKMRLSIRVKQLESLGYSGVIVCKDHSGVTDVPDKRLRPRGSKLGIPVVFADTTYEFITTYPTASFSYTIHDIYAEGINVVAQTPRKRRRNLVLGAHYDHIGRGELGGSRSKTEGIHYGADDNASGTAMVIELAHSIQKRRLRRYQYTVVAFSGEELGLLGSGYFVNNAPLDLSRTRLMMNFDMVGRLDSAQTLTVGGTGTCLSFDRILSASDSGSLHIVRDPAGTAPTDHTHFYYKNVPVMSFFTGLHGEYHTPMDVDSLINYEGMEQIYEYVMSILRQTNRFRNRKAAFQKSERPKKEAAAFKVTLGVMPDYAYQGKGLKVSGSNPGGPAEQGGVLAGDIIVKIGEMDIDDIYGYMNALSVLKPGQETPIEVLRNEERVVLNLKL